MHFNVTISYQSSLNCTTVRCREATRTFSYQQMYLSFSHVYMESHLILLQAMCRRHSYYKHKSSYEFKYRMYVHLGKYLHYGQYDFVEFHDSLIVFFFAFCFSIDNVVGRSTYSRKICLVIGDCWVNAQNEYDTFSHHLVQAVCPKATQNYVFY